MTTLIPYEGTLRKGFPSTSLTKGVSLVFPLFFLFRPFVYIYMEVCFLQYTHAEVEMYDRGGMRHAIEMF